MPVDLSEFGEARVARGAPCALGRARKELTPAKRAKLDGALERTEARYGRKLSIPAGRIAGWLFDQGFDVSVSTVRVHRRRECGCHDRPQ